MATPRSALVDPVHPMAYHLVSRCVRRSWLCGVDPYTGIDYSHRKPVLEQRLLRFSEAFPVELWAYSIMSNHFHTALMYHPTLHLTWSDDEVASRWLHAFPPKSELGEQDRELELARDLLLQDTDRLAYCRNRLGSLSAYMQHIKQPFAYQCNREDGVAGHFFEQRFYSGAILDEDSLVTAMAYVDLNPIRAQIADRLEECTHTAIAHRLNVVRNTPERLEQAIQPVVSGLETFSTPAKAHREAAPAEVKQTPNATDSNVNEPGKVNVESGGSPTNRESVLPRPHLTEKTYLEHLGAIIRAERGDTSQTADASRMSTWLARLRTLGKPQRAHGSEDVLREWLSARQFRAIERPLPS